MPSHDVSNFTSVFSLELRVQSHSLKRQWQHEVLVLTFAFFFKTGDEIKIFTHFESCARKYSVGDFGSRH